jgi:AraC-like DNA-binding protein
MAGNGGGGQERQEWAVGTYNPDYRLTDERPLWAGTHWHEHPGPPTDSVHYGLEVGIVLAGREEIQLDGCAIEGRAGDVWLCAMSEPHRYRIVEPNTQNLVLVFLPSFLGDEMLADLPWLTLFSAPAGDRPGVGTTQLRETVLGLARDLAREVERRDDGWQCAVRLDLLRLLFHLSRGWDHLGARSSGRHTYSGNLGRIMPALTLLYERTTSLVSRAQAARACGLGRSRFTMLFRETMGVSFRTFRRRVRIALAANALRSSRLSLQSIAERVGFADASHLHHAFVQAYGCTPGEYRGHASRRRRGAPDLSEQEPGPPAKALGRERR